MYLDLLQCNRWILYSQMHTSFKSHAQHHQDSVNAEFFPCMCMVQADTHVILVFRFAWVLLHTFLSGQMGACAAGA